MAALSDLTLEQAVEDRTFWGRLVESAVGAHLVNAAAADRCEVYYWRGRNREVDRVRAGGRPSRSRAAGRARPCPECSHSLNPAHGPTGFQPRWSTGWARQSPTLRVAHDGGLVRPLPHPAPPAASPHPHPGPARTPHILHARLVSEHAQIASGEISTARKPFRQDDRSSRGPRLREDAPLGAAR